MIWYLEPKTVPSTLVSAAAFAGDTKRKRKSHRPCSAPGGAKGKFKIVAYCTECEKGSAIPVGVRQQVATCKQGHSFNLC